jgi:hypothetical protein
MLVVSSSARSGALAGAALRHGRWRPAQMTLHRPDKLNAYNGQIQR